MTKAEKEKGAIYSYTAEHALENGVLVEVTPELRKEAGYR